MVDGKHATPAEEQENSGFREGPKTDGEDALSERLVRWFKQNDGWLNPDVEIAHNDSHGFHVRAIRPLGSPEIVRCPLKLTISHLNLDHAQSAVPHISSQLQHCLGKLPDHVLTYLLLIEQQSLARKGQSAWQPYFDCLPGPEAMTNAVWFDEEDMAYLVGTDVPGALRVKLHQLAEEFGEATRIMREADLSFPELFEFDNFRWAASIMSSRSFISTHILPDIETFPILFPVLDILNHSVDARVDWNFSPSSFSLKLVEPEAVHPGEELYNNYAPKQNGELLMGYGFCIVDNPVEQFALKIGPPPSMEKEFRRLGLYDASQVGLGMTTTFLDGVPKQEQHFLRPRGHRLGRYDNHVAWLRGIPPWIVHLFFVMALERLGIEPPHMDMDHPPARVVLQALLSLYEAVKTKSRSLPIHYQQAQVFSNEKQRYAAIYRDGQSKIIHAIRMELKAVVDKLSVHEQLPPLRPTIVSSTEALLTLDSDFQEYFVIFRREVYRHYKVRMSNWAEYGTQIAAQQDEDGSPAELSVWKILLFVFAFLTVRSYRRDSIVFGWTRALLDLHPLPPIDLIDENAGLDEEILQSYISSTKSPINDLNKFHFTESDGAVRERLAEWPLGNGSDRFERLGDRFSVWADEIVDRYAFSLPRDDDREDERIGMYLWPWQESETDDAWLYEDVDVSTGED